MHPQHRQHQGSSSSIHSVLEALSGGIGDSAGGVAGSVQNLAGSGGGPGVEQASNSTLSSLEAAYNQLTAGLSVNNSYSRHHNPYASTLLGTQQTQSPSLQAGGLFGSVAPSSSSHGHLYGNQDPTGGGLFLPSLLPGSVGSALGVGTGSASIDAVAAAAAAHRVQQHHVAGVAAAETAGAVYLNAAAAAAASFAAVAAAQQQQTGGSFSVGRSENTVDHQPVGSGIFSGGIIDGYNSTGVGSSSYGSHHLGFGSVGGNFASNLSDPISLAAAKMGIGMAQQVTGGLFSNPAGSSMGFNSSLFDQPSSLAAQSMWNSPDSGASPAAGKAGSSNAMSDYFANFAHERQGIGEQTFSLLGSSIQQKAPTSAKQAASVGNSSNSEGGWAPQKLTGTTSQPIPATKQRTKSIARSSDPSLARDSCGENSVKSSARASSRTSDIIDSVLAGSYSSPTVSTFANRGYPVSANDYAGDSNNCRTVSNSNVNNRLDNILGSVAKSNIAPGSSGRNPGSMGLSTAAASRLDVDCDAFGSAAMCAVESVVAQTHEQMQVRLQMQSQQQSKTGSTSKPVDGMRLDQKSNHRSFIDHTTSVPMTSFVQSAACVESSSSLRPNSRQLHLDQFRPQSSAHVLDNDSSLSSHPYQQTSQHELRGDYPSHDAGRLSNYYPTTSSSSRGVDAESMKPNNFNLPHGRGVGNEYLFGEASSHQQQHQQPRPSSVAGTVRVDASGAYSQAPNTPGNPLTPSIALSYQNVAASGGPIPPSPAGSGPAIISVASPYSVGSSSVGMGSGHGAGGGPGSVAGMGCAQLSSPLSVGSAGQAGNFGPSVRIGSAQPRVSSAMAAQLDGGSPAISTGVGFSTGGTAETVHGECYGSPFSAPSITSSSCPQAAFPSSPASVLHSQLETSLSLVPSTSCGGNASNYHSQLQLLQVQQNEQLKMQQHQQHQQQQQQHQQEFSMQRESNSMANFCDTSSMSTYHNSSRLDNNRQEEQDRIINDNFMMPIITSGISMAMLQQYEQAEAQALLADSQPQCTSSYDYSTSAHGNLGNTHSQGVANAHQISSNFNSIQMGSELEFAGNDNQKLEQQSDRTANDNICNQSFCQPNAANGSRLMMPDSADLNPTDCLGPFYTPISTVGGIVISSQVPVGTSWSGDRSSSQCNAPFSVYIPCSQTESRFESDFFGRQPPAIPATVSQSIPQLHTSSGASNCGSTSGFQPGMASSMAPIQPGYQNMFGASADGTAASLLDQAALDQAFQEALMPNTDVHRPNQQPAVDCGSIGNSNLTGVPDLDLLGGVSSKFSVTVGDQSGLSDLPHGFNLLDEIAGQSDQLILDDVFVGHGDANALFADFGGSQVPGAPSVGSIFLSQGQTGAGMGGNVSGSCINNIHLSSSEKLRSELASKSERERREIDAADIALQRHLSLLAKKNDQQQQLTSSSASEKLSQDSSILEDALSVAGAVTSMSTNASGSQALSSSGLEGFAESMLSISGAPASSGAAALFNSSLSNIPIPAMLSGGFDPSAFMNMGGDEDMATLMFSCGVKTLNMGFGAASTSGSGTAAADPGGTTSPVSLSPIRFSPLPESESPLGSLEPSTSKKPPQYHAFRVTDQSTKVFIPMPGMEGGKMGGSSKSGTVSKKPRRVPIYRQNKHALPRIKQETKMAVVEDTYSFTDDEDNPVATPADALREKQLELEVHRKLQQISSLHPELKVFAGAASSSDGPGTGGFAGGTKLMSPLSKAKEVTGTPSRDSACGNFLSPGKGSRHIDPNCASLKHVLPKKRHSMNPSLLIPAVSEENGNFVSPLARSTNAVDFHVYPSSVSTPGSGGGVFASPGGYYSSGISSISSTFGLPGDSSTPSSSPAVAQVGTRPVVQSFVRSEVISDDTTCAGFSSAQSQERRASDGSLDAPNLGSGGSPYPRGSASTSLSHTTSTNPAGVLDSGFATNSATHPSVAAVISEFGRARSATPSVGPSGYTSQCYTGIKIKTEPGSTTPVPPYSNTGGSNSYSNNGPCGLIEESDFPPSLPGEEAPKPKVIIKISKKCLGPAAAGLLRSPIPRTLSAASHSGRHQLHRKHKRRKTIPSAMDTHQSSSKQSYLFSQSSLAEGSDPVASNLDLDYEDSNASTCSTPFDDSALCNVGTPQSSAENSDPVSRHADDSGGRLPVDDSHAPMSCSNMSTIEEIVNRVVAKQHHRRKHKKHKKKHRKRRHHHGSEEEMDYSDMVSPSTENVPLATAPLPVTFGGDPFWDMDEEQDDVEDFEEDPTDQEYVQSEGSRSRRRKILAPVASLPIRESLHREAKSRCLQHGVGEDYDEGETQDANSPEINEPMEASLASQDSLDVPQPGAGGKDPPPVVPHEEEIMENLFDRVSTGVTTKKARLLRDFELDTNRSAAAAAAAAVASGLISPLRAGGVCGGGGSTFGQAISTFSSLLAAATATAHPGVGLTSPPADAHSASVVHSQIVANTCTTTAITAAIADGMELPTGAVSAPSPCPGSTPVDPRPSVVPSFASTTSFSARSLPLISNSLDNMFQKGCFVICKEDVAKQTLDHHHGPRGGLMGRDSGANGLLGTGSSAECNTPTAAPGSDIPLWRVDNQNLLQKYIPDGDAGENVYKSTSTYAGWCVEHSDRYLPVNVRYAEHSRSQASVILESPILELVPAVATEVSDSVEAWGGLSPPECDQHGGGPRGSPAPDHPLRKALDSYLNALILHALSSNVLQQPQANNWPFSKHMNEIESTNLEKKARLLNSVQWQDTFRDMLEWYPFLSVSEAEATGLPCQACATGTVDVSVQVYGEPYQPESLEPRQHRSTAGGSPIPSLEFHVCKYCSELATSYHKLYHMKYNLFRRCQDKVELIVEDAGPTVESAVVTEQCLRNRQWVNQAVQEYLDVWQSIS